MQGLQCATLGAQRLFHLKDAMRRHRSSVKSFYASPEGRGLRAVSAHQATGHMPSTR